MKRTPYNIADKYTPMEIPGFNFTLTRFLCTPGELGKGKIRRTVISDDRSIQRKKKKEINISFLLERAQPQVKNMINHISRLL